LNNAVLMHLDVVGNGRVIISLLATLGTVLQKFLSDKLLGINCAMTSVGIDCETIKFVLSNVTSHC